VREALGRGSGEGLGKGLRVRYLEEENGRIKAELNAIKSSRSYKNSF